MAQDRFLNLSKQSSWPSLKFQILPPSLPLHRVGEEVKITLMNNLKHQNLYVVCHQQYT